MFEEAKSKIKGWLASEVNCGRDVRMFMISADYNEDGS